MSSYASQALADSWRYYPHIFASCASGGAWEPQRHLNYVGKIVGEAIRQGNARQMYSLYRISFGELIDYARRRKSLKALMPQLIDNLKINKVTFGTKVDLVSKVTKKKSASK